MYDLCDHFVNCSFIPDKFLIEVSRRNIAGYPLQCVVQFGSSKILLCLRMGYRYNVTMKDATSTGLFLGQQKSTSDKSQELLPPILESLSRSVLTRVTLCGEDCKI